MESHAGYNTNQGQGSLGLGADVAQIYLGVRDYGINLLSLAAGIWQFKDRISEAVKDRGT